VSCINFLTCSYTHEVAIKAHIHMSCLQGTGRRTGLWASRISKIYFNPDSKNNLVASGTTEKN
jgi:hypothetical protein